MALVEDFGAAERTKQAEVAKGVPPSVEPRAVPAANRRGGTVLARHTLRLHRAPGNQAVLTASQQASCSRLYAERRVRDMPIAQIEAMNLALRLGDLGDGKIADRKRREWRKLFVGTSAEALTAAGRSPRLHPLAEEAPRRLI